MICPTTPTKLRTLDLKIENNLKKVFLIWLQPQCQHATAKNTGCRVERGTQTRGS